VARQAKDALDKLFESVRADIIAEHFAKEHNAATLFNPNFLVSVAEVIEMARISS
jgi:hypothetical protein